MLDHGSCRYDGLWLIRLGIYVVLELKVLLEE